jgi:hypothetical protein
MYRTQFHYNEVAVNVRPIRDEDNNLSVGWETLAFLANWKLSEDMSSKLKYILGFDVDSRVIDGNIVYIHWQGKIKYAFKASDVNREAAALLKKAKDFLSELIPGFRRRIKLTPYEIVKLWRRLKDFPRENIVRVKIGETIQIEWKSYRGENTRSRYIFEIYGKATSTLHSETSYECGSGFYDVIFDQGAAVIYAYYNGGASLFNEEFTYVYIAE